MNAFPIAGAVLLLSAGAALPEPLPFEGRWGFDAETCSIQRGESDLVPTEIKDGEIRYYESHCVIEEVAPIGSENTSAWRVRLSCAGEGETWTSESIFAIDYGTDERRRQWIDIDLESGSVSVRQGCD